MNKPAGAGHLPSSYNRRVGLAVCCPVTSQVKGYPFEVLLPAGLGVEGAVLSDQLKSLDWRVRKARRIAHCAGRCTRGDRGQDPRPGRSRLSLEQMNLG